MSEDKPLPCAFCGHEPKEFFKPQGEGSVTAFWCGNPNCLLGDVIPPILDFYEIPNFECWDVINRKIMAIRKKDFEAGRSTIAFNRDKVGGEWMEIKTFEDYIKEQHERAK